MGLRIGKSIRLGKHVRLNVSKSGLGVSAGVKGARIGINTKGQVRKSVGANGVYYTETTTIGKNNKVSNNVSTYVNDIPKELIIKSAKNSIICILTGIVLLIVGFSNPVLLLPAIPILIYGIVNKEQRFALTLQRAVMAYGQGNYDKSAKLLDKAKRYNETEQTELLESLLRDAV